MINRHILKDNEQLSNNTYSLVRLYTLLNLKYVRIRLIYIAECKMVHFLKLEIGMH